MELREPPAARPPQPSRAAIYLLLAANLVLLGFVAWQVTASSGRHDRGSAELRREVASKLEAAGAHGEAAAQYERYLEAGDADADARARLAYGLGSSFLEQGQYDKALRWLYEAQSLGAASTAVGSELEGKIVQALERSGRAHAARAALGASVRLDPADQTSRAGSDPVVARIGSDEIRRSDVERRLDRLPPEAARALAAADRQVLLRQFIADELLWRRAQRLGYDEDAEVLAQHAALLKDLAVARYLELDVVAGLEVDETDLGNFFAANRERYGRPDENGEPRTPELAEVRQAVVRDYRATKLGSAVEALVEEEMVAAGVELFPEALSDEP